MKSGVKIAVIVFVATLLGCNVIKARENRLNNKFLDFGMVRKVVGIDEASLEYFDTGDGGFSETPVLLLHGFGASAVWQWSSQADALCVDRRVIMPNLLWFGDSTDDAADFSLDRQVEVMVGLLDRLGIKKVDIVGLSYGGLVAYELGGKYPTRVNKVVISDSPGKVYTKEDHLALKERYRVNKVSDLLVPSTPADVKRLMELAYFDPPRVPRFALKNVLDQMYSKNRDEQAALLETLLEDLDEIASRPYDLQAPSLLIWGSDDDVFPLEIAKRLSSHLNAKLEVIEKAKHCPNMEHPDKFNEILLDFLSDN